MQKEMNKMNLKKKLTHNTKDYIKIDLYLEKISKFTDSKKYLLLDSLVEKYGREYNPANIVKENPNNVYCKFGYKVICCKHDLHDYKYV